MGKAELLVHMRVQKWTPSILIWAKENDQNIKYRYAFASGYDDPRIDQLHAQRCRARADKLRDANQGDGLSIPGV